MKLLDNLLQRRARVSFSWATSPQASPALRTGRALRMSVLQTALFLFFIFYFRFLQKYIFDLEIYMNIPRPPRCRAAGTWPPRSRAAGAYLQKKVDKKLRRGPWRTGRSAAGLSALQAARQRDSGPWPPACRVTGPPNPI